MATFPALVPTAMRLTPGRWGGTQISNLAGGITPVRHSSTEAGRALSLSFILTRTELYQLRDHCLGQLSNMDGFTFTTTTIPASYTPPGSWWFYTGPPQITDQQSDYFTVDIEVQSEPMPIFTMAGGAFHVRPRLAIGSPTAILQGTALTASPALSAGAITSAITSAITAPAPASAAAHTIGNPASSPGHNAIADTAPIAAADETPRLDGVASASRSSAWNNAPAADRAAPVINASSVRVIRSSTKMSQSGASRRHSFP